MSNKARCFVGRSTRTRTPPFEVSPAVRRDQKRTAKAAVLAKMQKEEFRDG